MGSPVLRGLGPGERFLVVPELLLDAARAAVGIVDEVEPERAPVDAVHRGHGRDPVPPQLRLLLGTRVVEPALERVGRRVRRHLTVDALHDPERAVEPRGVVLEPQHLRDGHVGVLAQRLHDPELRREVGLEEDGVVPGRDAHHEAAGGRLGVVRRASAASNRMVSFEKPVAAGISIAPTATSARPATSVSQRVS